MADELDDLLRPSLGEAHDVVDVRAPLSPELILFATFFIGIAGGWILTAWNDARCGLRRRIPWLAGAGVVLLAIWGGSLAWWLDRPAPARSPARAAEVPEPKYPREEGTAAKAPESESERKERIQREVERMMVGATDDPARQPAPLPSELRRERARDHRYLWKGIGLLAVWIASLPQRRRVRIARSQGIEMGSLGVPLAVAAVAGILLQFVIAFAIEGII